MRRLLQLAVALLLLGAGPAFAAEPLYQLVGKVGGEDPQVGFVDLSSVEREGTRVHVWMLWVYVDPVLIGSGRRGAYMLRENDYDCADRTVRQGQIKFYDDEGKLIRSTRAQETDYRPWIPGTPGTAIGRHFCDRALLPYSQEPLSMKAAFDFARIRPFPEPDQLEVDQET